MDGHFLDQPLPVGILDQHDPFLLIHHWNNPLKGQSKQNEVGVGPHPHRGFSPVTFIYRGAVHHRDSRGNNSIVEAGGTQWMNAGMGITHSERPTAELAETGGPFEIIQVWINSPASHKMIQPAYQAVNKETTPTFTSSDQKATCAVVCGEQFGLMGPVKSDWPIMALRIHLEKDGSLDVNVPTGFNTLLYNLNGTVEVNEERRCFMKDMVVFGQENQNIKLTASDTTDILLLAGKPIEEKVAKNGPFVMNTETEILEAFRDARMGKMGILIEEFD